MQTIRTLIALALNKYTHTATATFYLAVECADGKLDDRLHLLLIIAFRNVVDELFDDVQAFLDLVETNHVTCERVTFCTYNLVELNAVVSSIRTNLTQVVVPT